MKIKVNKPTIKNTIHSYLIQDANDTLNELNQMAKEDLKELNVNSFEQIPRWVFIKEQLIDIQIDLKALITVLYDYKYNIKLIYISKEYSDILKLIKKIINQITYFCKETSYHLLYAGLACIAPQKYIQLLAYKTLKRNLENIIKSTEKYSNSNFSYVNY